MWDDIVHPDPRTIKLLDGLREADQGGAKKRNKETGKDGDGQSA